MCIEAPPFIFFSKANLNLHEFIVISKEWQVDFLQLGEGVFKSKIEQLIYLEFHLAHVTFNSRVKQEGYSPMGYWSFAFVEEDNLYWRNYRINGKAVIIYAPGSKINAVSEANFKVNIFSIEENLLFKLLDENTIKEFEKKLNHHVIIPSDNSLWQSLSKEISSGIERYKNNNENNKNYFLTTFTKSLIELIKTSTAVKNKVSSLGRLELLEKAEQFIQGNITETITIPEIAQHCKVSERTLLYAFKQRFNVSVKGYIKKLKLNYVYFLLHKDLEDETITNIASRLGFWHMGQFHTDYKRFFGELPSEAKK